MVLNPLGYQICKILLFVMSLSDLPFALQKLLLQIRKLVMKLRLLQLQILWGRRRVDLTRLSRIRVSLIGAFVLQKEGYEQESG